MNQWTKPARVIDAVFRCRWCERAVGLIVILAFGYLCGASCAAVDMSYPGPWCLPWVDEPADADHVIPAELPWHPKAGWIYLSGDRPTGSDWIQAGASG